MERSLLFIIVLHLQMNGQPTLKACHGFMHPLLSMNTSRLSVIDISETHSLS